MNDSGADNVGLAEVDDDVTGKSHIVSDREREIFEIVNYVTISSMIGLFGLFSNIINIIIFIKHKFNESMNVSLLSLAVSDLFSLIFLQWFNVCVNPLLVNSDVPFYPPEFQYVTGGWPHVCFTRITLLITVFVAIERCLCIMIPLKVKTLLTPRRSLIIIIAIYVVMLLTLCPAYVTISIGWTFIPEKNRTLLGLVEADNRDEIESITIVLNVAMQILFFLAIVGSNVMLVYELQKKTKWRQGAMSRNNVPDSSSVATTEGSAALQKPTSLTPGPNPATVTKSRLNLGTEKANGAESGGGAVKGAGTAASNAANRDRKLGRMIVLLSTILFFCYLPSTICLVAQLVEPEFSIKGDYENIFFVGWSFAWVADAINSSVNIFVYYNMSSKYRATFRTLFSRWRRKWRVMPDTSMIEPSNASGSNTNGPNKIIAKTFHRLNVPGAGTNGTSPTAEETGTDTTNGSGPQTS